MNKGFLKIITALSLFVLIISSPVFSFASSMLEAAEERKSWEIQSNNIENWPEGPAIGAASAILMDADTGIILYEKNIHEQMYPASTTKLMTCLLAMEKEGVSLNDMVDFSVDAVYSCPWDGSNMGIDAGESMTLEDCLYGILLLSANEVSNAVGEYVSGDAQSFVDLMNERAKELGCVDTHFNNAHGYTDPDHYTSAYDLALIAREFFKNELLAKISRTLLYHWYPTDTQPDDIYLATKNYFIREIYQCEGLVGSKTGYTDESRNVLVTCAERNGMRLICVIMKEETPYQYEDTLSLFNYGFNNFETVTIADYEKRYDMERANFFKTDYDVFGDSSTFLSLDTSSELILPKTITFDELDSELVYRDDDSEGVLADIKYSYNGKYLGQAMLVTSKGSEQSFVFKAEDEFMTEEEDTPTFIYVNRIIMWIGIAMGVLVAFLIIKRIISNFHFARNRKYIIRNSRKRRM
ncbi:MAG: D-alanyl-D-alanine carboxypeptidase [Lachnospiraceae bacterium]|nr:D-alanyl-D-alanine carboxypeptidase [Lachnospiraceae bacterium]